MGQDPDEGGDVLDTTGLRCPLPVLKLERRLDAAAPGRLVRLLTDDPVARVDVPHFCAGAGHTILAATDHGTHIEFTIRRRSED